MILEGQVLYSPELNDLVVYLGLFKVKDNFKFLYIPVNIYESKEKLDVEDCIEVNVVDLQPNIYAFSKEQFIKLMKDKECWYQDWYWRSDRDFEREVGKFYWVKYINGKFQRIEDPSREGINYIDK